MKRFSLGSLALAAYAMAVSAATWAGTEPPQCGLPGAAPCPTPEPGTLALLAAGLAGVVAVRLIKRK